MSTGEVWLTSHQFAIIGPELDIMCLKGKGGKQKKRKLMFSNTYSMPGTWSLPSFNNPSSLGNTVGLIFTEETIRFEFNDLLKTTQLETLKLGEAACFLSPKIHLHLWVSCSLRFGDFTQLSYVQALFCSPILPDLPNFLNAHSLHTFLVIISWSCLCCVPQGWQVQGSLLYRVDMKQDFHLM